MGNANHDRWTERLSEYLDDELDATERTAVDEHLRTCGDCRQMLDDLRLVVGRARLLPDVPPTRELWPAIAAAIDASAARGSRVFRVLASNAPRRFSFTLPQLVAASLALIVSSGGLVWMARFGGDRTDLPPVSAEWPVVTPVTLADAHYDDAIADLQQTLDAGRGNLDAETVRVLEENLKAIDRAIDQCRRALVADPANAYLRDHLVAAKKRKLGLLRLATAKASSQS